MFRMTPKAARSDADRLANTRTMAHENTPAVLREQSKRSEGPKEAFADTTRRRTPAFRGSAKRRDGDATKCRVQHGDVGTLLARTRTTRCTDDVEDMMAPTPEPPDRSTVSAGAALLLERAAVQAKYDVRYEHRCERNTSEPGRENMASLTAHAAIDTGDGRKPARRRPRGPNSCERSSAAMQTTRMDGAARCIVRRDFSDLILLVLSVRPTFGLSRVPQ